LLTVKACGLFPAEGYCATIFDPVLRITNYRRRVVIAFTVGVDTVSILGIFYGGRNYEVILSETGEHPSPTVEDT
jgi:toxin ParE1/3/4